MDFLRRSPRRAELVSRLAGALRRNDARPEAVEQGLSELEREGAVLVREHYCADPHLEGADLRVAAVVDAERGASHGADRRRLAAVAERVSGGSHLQLTNASADGGVDALARWHARFTTSLTA